MTFQSGHFRGQSAPVTIGSFARIGAGATIVGPTQIGERAIVMPNAVVVGDVPEGETTCGILQRKSL
ncbi:acyltransferase [Paraburkholderia aspalathi]|uniref:acyltransferase n=1 Tax=Paraburkholderia aspalathi TaxID=1324617 RepID=UPI0038B712A9